MEYICDNCRIITKKASCVFYSKWEMYLCRSCYRKWLKKHREIEAKHGESAGNKKLCALLERHFLKFIGCWRKEAKP